MAHALLVGVLAGDLTVARVAAHRASPTMAVVRLCVSAPIGAPSLHLLARGMFDAVVLATQDSRQWLRRARQVAGMPLEMDDSPIDTGGERERANAARCVADRRSIAYIGPLNSIAAAASEPILNRAGMAQISPSTTQPLLTSAQTRPVLEPRTFNGTLKYVTFYRLVADDRALGAATAAYLTLRRKAATFFSLDDNSVYGIRLLASSKSCADTLGLRVVGKTHLRAGSSQSLAAAANAVAGLIAALRPDGVLYGGGPESVAILAGRLQRHGYHGPIVGGDALLSDPTLPGQVETDRSIEVLATNIGPDPGSGPARFNDRFLRRFGYRPPMYAALAYDAATTVYEAVLAAHRAMKGRESAREPRSALLPYIRFADRMGVTGRIHFDGNGDTLTRTVSLYRAGRGGWSYDGLAPDCRAAGSR